MIFIFNVEIYFICTAGVFCLKQFLFIACILQLIALFFYNICEIISESAVPYGPP